MFKGKKTCKILKEIRAQIAKENDILYITSECKHQGDCLGTCPKCEAEVRYLEKELEKRAKLGKAVTVAGLAATITVTSLSATACRELQQTDGDMIAPPDNTLEDLQGEQEEYRPTPGDIAITEGEPAIPRVMLPDYEEFADLLEDTNALYAFLKGCCNDNDGVVRDYSYPYLSDINWTHLTTSTETEQGRVTEYYSVHAGYNYETQQDEETVIGLVFTPAEGGDPEDIATYLWTAVTVEIWTIETPAGDMPLA